MKTGIRIVCLLLCAVIAAGLISCVNTAENQPGSVLPYTAYRYVTGITGYEVEAIAVLRENVDYFVIGMLKSTEAFLCAQGEIRGFTPIFAQWLSGFFEIPFLVRHFDWLELLYGLESGDVDFTGDMTATDERRELYFMTDAIAHRSIKYFRLAGSTPISEIAQERLPRYAIMYGSTFADDLARYVSGRYEPVIFHHVKEAYELLRTGGADAIISENVQWGLFDLLGDIVMKDFFPQLYSPVSLAAQRPELEPVISVMQRVLNSQGIGFIHELYDRGDAEYLKHKLSLRLTEEEIEFIANNPVIPFAAEHDNYPVSFFSAFFNQWQGISFDVISEIESLTGLSFEVKNDETASFATIVEMLEAGEVYLISELIWTSEKEGRFIWPENAFFYDRSVLISRVGTENTAVSRVFNKTVGLTRGTVHAELFISWFPNHPDVIFFNSQDETFEALAEGVVDMVMKNYVTLLYLINYRELPDFIPNIIFDNALMSTFGINKEQVILRSIIDKAMELIDTEIISGRWQHRTYDFRLRLVQAQMPWIIGAAALLSLVVVLIVALLIRSRRAGKNLEKMVEKRTAELRHQTATLSTLIDTIPDLMFIKDLELKFVHVNKSLLRYYDRREEDVLGRDAACLGVPDKNVEEFHSWDYEAISLRHTVVNEEYSPRADGAERLLETIKTPIIVGDEVTGIVGIARDITIRKEMEQEIADRWEVAEKASQIKSTFLAHMSHEIRTPMNSIIGFSELALGGDISPKTHDYLEKILENSQWLLLMVNDLLDISKVESGKMELENIPFDIHDMFDSCKMSVMPLVIEKGLSLICSADLSADHDKMLVGDPMRLRQILMNLLTNAIKFTQEGVIKITASVKERDGEKLILRFEISDSGIGISPEQIERVFEPFEQAESGTARKFGGTGLGLPITKNIIELMGGKLNVQSELGIGTDFYFDIAFETIEASALEGEAEFAFPKDKRPVFSGEVLLCEDNKMNQEVFCEHLSRVGLAAVIAENGAVGIEKVRERMEKGQEPFNLIFMDIHMPVMDGFEASRQITAMDVASPIIAMTANVMSQGDEIYQMNGMSGFIGKPYTTKEIWRCLMRYLLPVGWQDLNTGIQRQTDEDLRIILTMCFLRENRDRAGEIEQAIYKGDIKLAHRLAHNLRGNAGQLGKTELQKSAEEVESALEGGVSRVTPVQLADLKQKLDIVIHELSELEAVKSGEAAPLEKLDEAQAKKLLQELLPLLEQGDTKSLEFVDKLKAINGTERLVEYIRQFEFEDAANELKNR